MRERWLVLAAIAFTFVALAATLPAAGSAQAPAPDGSPPTRDILSAAPFDRITLSDNSVIHVDPVSPRPLPTYDPKQAKKRRVREIPAEGNIGLPGEKSKVPPPLTDEEDEKDAIVIHLLDGEVRDFSVKRSDIKTIDYFEDLLLAEGDRLVLAGDFARGFECFLKVQARDPKWRGLDEHVNRALFAEGTAALLEADGERGLRLLRELAGRKPDYPGLADKLAASYGARATRAFDLGMYAKGRKILHDVESLAPDHPGLRAVRDRFVSRAKDLAAAAAKRKGSERLDALTEALRVWPGLKGADAAYRDAFEAAPTLDVAVLDVSHGAGPWVRSPADQRVSRLLYRPVLARDDDEAMQGKPLGQLAARVSSTDLGRRIAVELGPKVAWNDGSRAVSAIDVARGLTDATLPSSPAYNARWADLLEQVDTPEENRVEILLTRATLKPGNWLLGPIGPAHAGGDGRVAREVGARELVGDGPYRLVSSKNDQVEFRLVDSAPAPRAKIVRIREQRHASGKAALGALIRGEVALVGHVAPDRVTELASSSEFKVGKYERPSVHLIALDGRNFTLRNRNLRRGLSYAIDRRALLEETILRRPPDATNAVADGPFVRGSYADAPDVKPLGHDPLLARMLVAAAKKELGGKPLELTFEYPAIPEAQVTCPKLVEALQQSGLKITAVERSESELEADLRAGKRFDLAYRATRIAEPVADVGAVLSPCHDAPPFTDPLAAVASPRILQLLLQLERAPEWPTAKAIVLEIDRECRDELPVLPLWQVEEHYAWRTRLRGPADTTERLYDGLATWEVEPWFAKDPW